MRYIPNAISITRLTATPVLLFAAATGRVSLFKWLLLASLLSDILDGLIARTFHLESALGAFLDSTADIVLWLVAGYGLIALQWTVLRTHWHPLAAILVLFVWQFAAAFRRYGRISSFHTTLMRIAAYVEGIFVMSLFLWGFHAWIFYLMSAVAILAFTEEILLVYALPQWQPNVGGLYRVLRGDFDDW